MLNKQLTPKELYEQVCSDNGQTTVTELAKGFGLKSPNLTHYVTSYAVEHNLPIPNFCFKKEKSLAMVKPNIHRKTSEQFVQISPLRLRESGLGETLDFKFVGDPATGIVLVIPNTQAGNSVEEVIRLMYPDPVKATRGTIQNLRLPVTNKTTPRKLQTS